MKKEELTTIILAGGQSRRMGQDKGLIHYKSKPMIRHIIDTTSTLSSFFIISANSNDYKSFGYPVIEDEIKNKGPLSGLASSLKASTTEHNIIINCDMPLLTAETLEYIAKRSTAAINVAKVGLRVHPLVGIYSKSILPELEIALSNNQLSVMKFIENIGCNYIDIPEAWEHQFKNFNFPDQLTE